MQVTTKPSKQRKMLYQAPDHVRRRFFAAPLSSELAASQGVKNLPVRSGDTIRVMRGDHKGLEGKISRVDRKEYRVFVEGLTREKVDGTAIPVAIHPSKVMLTSLNLDDKWRRKILERKKTAATKEVEKKAEKKPRKRIAEKLPEVVEVKKRAIDQKAPRKKPAQRRKKAEEKKTSEKAKAESREAVKKEKSKKEKRTLKRKPAKKSEGGE